VIVRAVDPGSELSALVRFDTITGRVLDKCKVPNDEALAMLASDGRSDHLAIEMAESFGAKVWGQVFITVLWTGCFIQVWKGIIGGPVADRPFMFVMCR